MRNFLIRRLLFAVLSLIIASMAVFGLAHAKEDPINLFIQPGYFISPETLMQKRDAFNVGKFFQSYCKDLKLEFKEVYSKYEDFVYKFSSELQRDFDEKNKFQTRLFFLP